MLSDFFQYLTGTTRSDFGRNIDQWAKIMSNKIGSKVFPSKTMGAFWHFEETPNVTLYERGSLYRRVNSRLDWLLSDWPVTRPPNWPARVNQPMSETEIGAIHLSIRLSRPLENSDWTRDTAEQLRLAYSLEPRGRRWIAKPAQRSISN